MINKAKIFAENAHKGQMRKGTQKPYIVHPIEVAEIVATLTDNEEVIMAAYLHDTIEDCEGVTSEVLEKEFGPRVTYIVTQESEDKTKSWAQRKGHTIDTLKTAEIEVQMIALADKLSNMRDIDRDYPVCGEQLWDRFRMKNKSIIGWYYKGVQDSLKEGLGHTEAYREYCDLIDKNFG